MLNRSRTCVWANVTHNPSPFRIEHRCGASLDMARSPSRLLRTCRKWTSYPPRLSSGSAAVANRPPRSRHEVTDRTKSFIRSQLVGRTSLRSVLSRQCHEVPARGALGRPTVFKTSPEACLSLPWGGGESFSSTSPGSALSSLASLGMFLLSCSPCDEERLSESSRRFTSAAS
jgi:hypothetical protein